MDAIQDTSATNKALHALWQERRPRILSLLMDLIVTQHGAPLMPRYLTARTLIALLENTTYSAPRSECQTGILLLIREDLSALVGHTTLTKV